MPSAITEAATDATAAATIAAPIMRISTGENTAPEPVL
jgi:hypothetical protein